MSEPRDITRLLHAAATGDDDAFARLVERVYSDLERMAARQMRVAYGTGLPGVTLEPAALVHETFLKLSRDPHPFENRRSFFAFANKVMRSALLDYQRTRKRRKRGRDAIRVSLSGLEHAAHGHDADAPLIDLMDALDRLEALDPRKAEVLQLKVFWGLEMQEVARTLGVSLSTVERDWRFTRSWLAEELGL